MEPHFIECLAGAGVKRKIKADAGNALNELQQFIDKKEGWLFGHLGYDLKNEIEELNSLLPDSHRNADLFFFEPEIVQSKRSRFVYRRIRKYRG